MVSTRTVMTVVNEHSHSREQESYKRRRRRGGEEEKGNGTVEIPSFPNHSVTISAAASYLGNYAAGAFGAGSSASHSKVRL